MSLKKRSTRKRHNHKLIARSLSIAYNNQVMISSEKNLGKNIKTTSLKLHNGWRGMVVLSDTSGKNFSKTDWADCLSQPQLLLENVERTLKTEGQNCVVVKNLTVGTSQLKVVIKRHCHGAGIRQFFRSFRPGKAIRNFKAALELLGYDIPVVAPFAAMHQRRKLLTKQSIYITEYLENSFNLHTFASKQFPANKAEQFAIKKQLCRQLATILAMLHKNNLWHRDSKATNFIVHKDTAGKYSVLLVDMDGIKRYFLWHRSRRFRTLWRLAASLMPVATVNRTDYLRTFTTYSNLTGLEVLHRRRIFHKLAHQARAKQLRNIIKTVNE
jgi:serine/threonine protein kinase